MLIAKTNSGLMILGIDAENVRRLKAGEPIVKSLSRFGGKDDVVIIYGETTDAIREDLARLTGPLPAVQELPEPH